MFEGERILKELEAQLESRRAEAKQAYDQRCIRYIDEPTTRLELLLKGHLYIESLVIGLIEATSVNPSALSLDRMGFANKVSIAAAMGALPDDMMDALRRLNRVRNEVAHELDAPISAEQVAHIKSLLPAFLQEILDGESDYDASDPDRDLRDVLSVTAAAIDGFRVNQIFRRENADLLAREVGTRSAVERIRQLADELPLLGRLLDGHGERQAPNRSGATDEIP